MAVDIKTTSKYEAGCYATSHQNFYLPALSPRGVRTLRYVITDFKQVYCEEYDRNLDLAHQEEQIEAFCRFLEDNRPAITDSRIFGI